MVKGVPFKAKGVPFKAKVIPFKVKVIPFKAKGVLFEVKGFPFKEKRVPVEAKGVIDSKYSTRKILIAFYFLVSINISSIFTAASGILVPGPKMAMAPALYRNL